MSGKENVRLSTVIMNCLNAVLWITLAILDAVKGYSNTAILAMRVFCAVGWGIAAVLWLIRYRKARAEGNKNEHPND